MSYTQAKHHHQLYIKSLFKKLPILGGLLIKVNWRLNALRNRIKILQGHYPTTKNEPPYFTWHEYKPASFLTRLNHTAGLLNKIADESDFADSAFRTLFLKLREPVGKMERKSWEFVKGIIGLHKLGAVKPESTAIGIGSGCEKPLYYFAKHCKKVIGTDLYLNNHPGWAHTSNSDILKNPSKYAPFSYPKERLELRHMSAMSLEFADNTFDFAFSFSSIEHFGSRHAIEKTMQEIERVLKPGGIACITTELIINEGVTHDEYFTLPELQKHMIDSHSMELVGKTGDELPIDFSISDETLSHVLDQEKDVNRPISIIYKNGDVIFIPVLLFFRKKASS